MFGNRMPRANEWHSIAKHEGLVIRGAGILLIMLHNFTHWIPPKTGENEFGFSPSLIHNVFGQMSETPHDAWRISFSFFGHYGVHLFTFLSAYGLTKSALAAASQTRWVFFIKRRFLSVFPAVLLAGTFFLIYSTVLSGPQSALDSLIPLLKQALLVAPFLGDPFDPIGPWWFLAMIFQFYLIFPFLLRITETYGTIPLGIVAVGAIALQVAVHAHLVSIPVSLNLTVIGHLPEFCFGIWAARAGKWSNSKMWLALAALIFVSGQFFFLPWTVSSLAFVVIAVPIFRCISTSGKLTGRVLAFFGNLALPLFLVNGYLRSPLAWYAQQGAENHPTTAWLSTLAFSILFVIWSAIWAFVAARTESHLRTRLRTHRNSAGDGND